MTTDFPTQCPTCDSLTDALRDRCSCGRAHCFACGELLADPTAGEAQS
jgi:ribosomal protein S27E